MKKIIIITLLILSLISVVNATEYDNITGNSIFVVGVEWQKIPNTYDYTAYITIDLNYNQYMNPLHRFDIVSPYNWSNWWAKNSDGSSFDFGSDQVGTTDFYTNENGDYVDYTRLNYYFYPQEMAESGCYDFNFNKIPDNMCNEPKMNTRVAYFGLPFYIDKIHFQCDVNNNNRGVLDKSADLTQYDIFSLLHMNYEGLPNAVHNIGTLNVPLGFGTYRGEIVRYNQLPYICRDMVDLKHARLQFTLKPNAQYRRYNPNIVGSETWQYSDIISTLPALTNNQNLPFQLDINYNFTGNWWNSSYVANISEINMTANLYYNPADVNLDCIIEGIHWYQGTLYENRKAKLSELTSEQMKIINSGQGITCTYPTSTAVTNLNDKAGEDVLNVISLQTQQQISLQKDIIEQKLKLKKFITQTIIPSFVTIMIIIFYAIELFLLIFTLFGLLPLMYNQFIKGIKDAWIIDELIKLEQQKKQRGN